MVGTLKAEPIARELDHVFADVVPGPRNRRAHWLGLHTPEIRAMLFATLLPKDGLFCHRRWHVNAVRNHVRFNCNFCFPPAWKQPSTIGG